MSSLVLRSLWGCVDQRDSIGLTLNTWPIDGEPMKMARCRVHAWEESALNVQVRMSASRQNMFLASFLLWITGRLGLSSLQIRSADADITVTTYMLMEAKHAHGYLRKCYSEKGRRVTRPNFSSSVLDLEHINIYAACG